MTGQYHRRRLEPILLVVIGIFLDSAAELVFTGRLPPAEHEAPEVNHAKEVIAELVAKLSQRPAPKIRVRNVDIKMR
jgi:hypothetical protein